MSWRDLYPPDLNAVGDPSELEDADEVVYRQVHRRLVIPALPGELRIGDVAAYFVQGPIYSQVTALRQQAGWPPVFDKHMQRALAVGAGEPLTVLQIAAAVPQDLNDAIPIWRRRAERALGLLVATLDERLALEELGEDVVLLQAGRPIAAADLRHRVRTFMPFDVTAEDQATLASLAEISLEEGFAHAASLLLDGLREGPTERGFLTLWLAIDAVVGTRKTQVAAVNEGLANAGFDPTWMTMPTGRLAGIRGDLAHGRTVDATLVADGYADSEAIARALVRHSASIEGGWPVSPTPTAFPLPLGRRIAAERDKWVVDWHDAGLPPAEDVAPLELPRVDAVLGGHDAFVRVEGASADEVARRLRFWGLAALDAADVDTEPFTVRINDDELDGARSRVNRQVIVLSTALAQPTDEPGEARLAINLCRCFGELLVMRIGVDSVSLGRFLIAIGGGWLTYHEWVVRQEMPAELLTRVDPATASIEDNGAMLGLAVAGDPAALEAMSRWAQADPEDGYRAIGGRLLVDAAQFSTFADYLDFTRGLVKVQAEAEPTTDWGTE